MSEQEKDSMLRMLETMLTLRRSRDELGEQLIETTRTLCRYRERNRKLEAENARLRQLLEPATDGHQ